MALRVSRMLMVLDTLVTNHQVVMMITKLLGFVVAFLMVADQEEVYEFKSDSWRVVGVDDDKNSFNGFLELPESSVCLRGTPYWLGYIYGKAFATIQSFDFSKERFEPLFLPPSSMGSDKFENSLSLGVFRGDRLSLLHKSRVTSKIHLWVMKKHWSRLMTVALPECYTCIRYSSYFIENNGKLVLFIRHFVSMCTYIAEENQEYQQVVSPSMDPSVRGSGCYDVPSLLPVPGLLSR
ncbi:putative F-box/LRR-repeat/kelch-repeat protein [Cardamine amara subsp. amara]|uniref:F-box/LRR-repeat/kelch-repeat protein n=1 Tax=Cardamine amara subsp. amara TaxID=228776 RepID=A0ABD1A878_CARAN